MMSRRGIVALFSAAALALPLAAMSATTAHAATPAFKVLVFSKTTGYRHASIPDGIAAIEKLGQDNGFAVDATEDATRFNDADLAKYQTVVFLSTTGDPLDQQSEKDAFQRYIEHGGGYVGIHAAADSGYTWAWYGGLVGAYFRDHPAIQQATVNVAGQGTAATRDLPNRWTRTDEWYNYRSNPRPDVRVLATLDERTYDPVGYSGGSMGADHPISWCHPYDGGRSFYTGMGHTSESYTEPQFLSHILGGIEMTAGAAKFNCDPDSTG
ncbi:ThuA domain-containing protein [Streptomyces sp. RB17]|uniref:ThuA domain-containing protein n=1 Tax=Streptomyces sp. RB17 TaxID=2585197 RepID=UPI001E3B0288|nr:ThuA domain-containing protein [Streptomyces sp. RB17]